ncbi:hypothetical protein WA026_009736 [Henosepilachna vigintioctopunctata]|uniref:Uncharacterized protein n=1 Tax=Henosepilachna vigintioctopunctata TaxID=420089 RepID=A0AAW1TKW0_9CUCU
MKFVVVFLSVAMVAVFAIPLNQDGIVVDDEGNMYYTQLVPLNRERRQSGDYIKAGAVHSSKYGGGGQIVANKNLYSGKHHSIDAQAKYNQYGKHREGWGGINYSLRW